MSLTGSPRLRGSVRVPGDKSSSHRALMLAALAEGTSTIEGISSGLDVRCTLHIIEQLGAAVSSDGIMTTVVGPSQGLRPSADALDCGNSGTTMRLMAGIVSAVEGTHELVGDPSLERRPMDRVAVPLSMMGATIRGHGEPLTAPLHIEGLVSLRAVDYHVPVPSAQVKSAILFAALHASGHSVVSEDVRTRSTTEDMFVHAGITLHSVDHGSGRSVTVTPGRPRSARWQIPGDPSQAAFFAVLGVVHADALIEVQTIDTSRERIGFVGVLQRMGATIALESSGGATALRSQSSPLHGTEIHSREIPSVDEVPALVVAASAAEGITAFRDMAELRIKESDRFAGSLSLAKALGCLAWEEGDDFFVEGLGTAGAFRPFSLPGNLDHRMVMASAIAGIAGAGCTIEGYDTVTSSYPGFFDDLASLQ